VSANRKKFRGTLERVAPAADGRVKAGWQLVWSDAPPVKPGQKVSKKRPPAPLQALGFSLDEVREARLAPIVSFKGPWGREPWRSRRNLDFWACANRPAGAVMVPATGNDFRRAVA
jgi:hypothetical protein